MTLLFLNLLAMGGQGAEDTGVTAPGLEATAMTRRLHAVLDDRKLHATEDDRRLHATIKDANR